MFADELISLHEFPPEVAPFSDRFEGLTASDGYAAGQALHAHRLAAGWRPVGRKIGFTHRTIWYRYGVTNPSGERSTTALSSMRRVVAPRCASPDSSTRVLNPKFAFT